MRMRTYIERFYTPADYVAVQNGTKPRMARKSLELTDTYRNHCIEAGQDVVGDDLHFAVKSDQTEHFVTYQLVDCDDDDPILDQLINNA